MSFGFGGGGFGSSNNSQQQNTGFGGFGSNTNTGFGQQQTPAFGGAANNTTSNVFGGGSGFGTSNTTPFATAKPFGATNTSGSTLFGGSTATTGGTGFGGFGSSTTNTTNTSSPFGGGTTGGGLFGNTANKPAFGSGTATGGGLFGSTNTSTTFGQGNNQSTSLFGSAQGTALGPNVAESQGTGGTPFQPFIEKDSPTSTTSNHFQSISFMSPYQKYSFEELRLADYNQGRRFGNNSGQAGAFGVGTGFGGGFGQQATQPTTGFGTTNTGGGLFGSTQTTTSSSPFGASTTATGGFGSSTAGGLFGQKPAQTGGLFGSAASASQPAGGLFGTAQPSTGGGFGNNTGGGLFGGTQNQSKPGFSFGTTTTSAGSAFGGGGFGTGTGTATAGTSNLFGGANQTSSLFGGQQQQQAPAANPFGGTNQTQSAFGTGFGNNTTPKPGGLFGSTTNTGGGLFGGNTQNTQTSMGGFGANQPASNLFGQKPAATNTGGLFSNTNTGATGGLFGNNNQSQPAQGSNLFSMNSTDPQKPPFGTSATGAFGANPGGLFGNNNNNNNSLFNNPGANNQSQQGVGLFTNSGNNNSSLFGGPQQNPLQPPEAMTASIFDRSPYGSAAIYSGLPPPPQSSPGPIATPILAGQNKPKKRAPLPSPRFQTPQKRGFGFTYSTYGTPNSASSIASTPGVLGNSLLSGSIGRSLGKSFSTSNLRRNYDNDGDTLLSPGAFSAGSTRHSGVGSMKKLTIDRSLRTDLFGPQAFAALPGPEKIDQSRAQPSILKKKVSFDKTTIGGGDNDAQVNGSYEEPSSSRDSSSTPTPQEPGYLRSSSRTNGRSNGMRSGAQPAQSEMEQVKGNELAIVPEDDSPETSNPIVTHVPAKLDQADPEPGRYYMRPSREDLRKMPRDRLKKVSGFTIGRERCGNVVFDQPVDLTTVDLDNIYDNIAVITLRSVTVYPETDKKPPMGKGLNVPATITLENSWPRSRDKRTPSYEKSGPKFNKHVDRLRKVQGTEFVKYDKDTGEWVFKVPHFTTYALEYDDDDTSEIDMMRSSVLSETSDTPTPKTRQTPGPPQSVQQSSPLSEESSHTTSPPDDTMDFGADDTFDFKKKRLFPGAFEDVDDDEELEEDHDDKMPFLDERSAPSPSENGGEEPSDFHDESDRFVDQSLIIRDNDVEMAGSFPQQSITDEDSFKPKSILKASHLGFGTPGKPRIIGDDWAEQLQRTISPRKHDRQALRESQARFFNEFDHEDTPTAGPSVQQGKGFATSIDLMNSLFGKDEARKSGRVIKQNGKARTKAFEWPYPKRSKDNDDEPAMNEFDRAFHHSFKPTWGPGSTLLYGAKAKHKLAKQRPSGSASLFNDTSQSIESGKRDIRFAKYVTSTRLTPENFAKQRDRSEISDNRGVPFAEAKSLPFWGNLSAFSTNHEEYAWELASILFDDHYIETTPDLPNSYGANFEQRIRKDRLSAFWSRLCHDTALAAVASAPTAEERAIAYLSAHRIAEACDALIDGKDFRLAALVAQIGGDGVMHDQMKTQIETWRKANVLSEMTDPIRAIYEILAGNVFECQGAGRAHVEDRAETFVISKKFKLDWKRAFGLRLWYAIRTDDPIETAVKKFSADLQNEESVRPLPWFIEEGVSLSCNNEHPAEREDILWGILRLYAESKDGSTETKLTDIVMPENITGNPLDYRLSFDIYHALNVIFPDQADPVRADQLAWDFATQLEAAGKWHWALFAALHITEHSQRQHALQALLSLHAAEIEDGDNGNIQHLTEGLKIPEAWIWESKALYARTVLVDHVKEVEFLLRAKNWDEAHNTLCRIVAPQAIIEEDYDTLFRLFENFARKDKVKDWHVGGQVYLDYVRLRKGVEKKEQETILKRLVGNLVALGQERGMGFVEGVAVKEMSAVVGKAVMADDGRTIEGSKVLRMPATSDRRLQRTVDLSLEYYKALMAHGN